MQLPLWADLYSRRVGRPWLGPIAVIIHECCLACNWSRSKTQTGKKRGPCTSPDKVDTKV